MLNELRFGQEVRLWPAAGLRVVMGPGGQDLPLEGAAVIWSEWWYARYSEGACHLHDPRPGVSIQGTEGTTEGLPQPAEQLGPPGIDPAIYADPDSPPASPAPITPTTTRS